MRKRMLKYYWKNALEKIAKQEATICELELRLEVNMAKETDEPNQEKRYE